MPCLFTRARSGNILICILPACYKPITVAGVKTTTRGTNEAFSAGELMLIDEERKTLAYYCYKAIGGPALNAKPCCTFVRI